MYQKLVRIKTLIQRYMQFYYASPELSQALILIDQILVERSKKKKFGDDTKKA